MQTLPRTGRARFGSPSQLRLAVLQQDVLATPSIVCRAIVALPLPADDLVVLEFELARAVDGVEVHALGRSRRPQLLPLLLSKSKAKISADGDGVRRQPPSRCAG